jgi:adenosylcobinamide-phosphate synthase
VVEPWVVLGSLALEAVVGYPAGLHARIPHPVVWVGGAISALERWWNRPGYSFARRRLLGFVAVVLVTGAAIGAGWAVQGVVASVAQSIVWDVGAGVPDRARAEARVSAVKACCCRSVKPAPLLRHTDAPTGMSSHSVCRSTDAPGEVLAATRIGCRGYACSRAGAGAVPFVGHAVAGAVGAAGAMGAAGAASVAGSSGVALAVHLAVLGFVALVGTVGLAQRSLFEHVNNVLTSLRTGDLPASREKVSHIVGRDTRQLDAAGVSAAALESLAESFNDGIVAPAFWFLIAGLPGLFAYKVINTADSLIGHKEERWRAFGWTAARVDDVANLVPARIAGVLLVLAGLRGFGVMLSDAAKHASPNAGWPEAAMAGALRIKLGGPATYDGVLHERPVFGTGPAPGVAELHRGLRLYVVACGLLWLAIAAVGVVTAGGASWLR